MQHKCIVNIQTDASMSSKHQQQKASTFRRGRNLSWRTQIRLDPDQRVWTFCCGVGCTNRVGAGVRLVWDTIGDKGRDRTRQETRRLAESFTTWYFTIHNSTYDTLTYNIGKIYFTDVVVYCFSMPERGPNKRGGTGNSSFDVDGTESDGEAL